MLKDYDRSFKIIIAGSTGVGKSSLLLRYVDNVWSGSTLSTIGVDFKFKSIVVNGQKVKMQIWDTAGSEAFKSIVSAYYRGADAVILVYDYTDKISFAELKNFWIEEVKKYKQPSCQLVLLGNKSDLGEGATSESELKSFVATEGISIHKQTSAKTGNKVDQAFVQLAEVLLKKKPKKKQTKQLRMSIQGPEHAPETGKKCC